MNTNRLIKYALNAEQRLMFIDNIPNVFILFPVHIILMSLPLDSYNVINSMRFVTTQIQFSQ